MNKTLSVTLSERKGVICGLVSLVVMVLASCSMSFKLDTKVAINDPEISKILKCSDEFSMQCESALNAGPHTIGSGNNKCVLVVPGTLSTPLPVGVETVARLSNFRVQVTSEKEIDASKSEGTLSIHNTTPTVPVVILTEIHYKSFEIPLAIPFTSVTWKNGSGSVEVFPKVTSLNDILDTNREGNIWVKDDVRLPKESDKILQILSYVEGAVANFAQYSAARVGDSLQSKSALSKTLVFQTNAVNTLWKSITINQAKLAFKKETEYSYGDSKLNIGVLSSGDQSFLTLQNVKVDSNFDVAGRLKSAIHLRTGSHISAADALTIADNGDISIDSDFHRTGEMLSVESKSPQSISLSDCEVQIGKQSHTRVQTQKFELHAQNIKFARNLDKKSNDFSVDIDGEIFGPELKSQTKECLVYGVGVGSLKFTGNVSKHATVDDAKFAFANGATFKDVFIDRNNGSQHVMVELAQLALAPFEVIKSYNNFSVKSTGLTFHTSFVSFSQGRRSASFRQNPNTSYLKITDPFVFNLGTSALLNIPKLECVLDATDGILANDKDRISFGSLTGNCFYDGASDPMLKGKISFSGQACPVELIPILSGAAIDFDFGGFEFNLSKNAMFGSLEKAKIRLSQKKAISAIKSKLPERYEIPEGLGDQQVVHVRHVKTRAGGSIDRISSSLAGRFLPDSTFEITHFTPYLYLRLKGKYDHCVWFSCHEREQFWDIDATLSSRGKINFQYNPGLTLAEASIIITPLSVSGTSFHIERMAGMNSAIKLLLAAGEWAQTWFNLDKRLYSAIQGPKTIALFQNAPKDSLLQRFSLKQASFTSVGSDVEFNFGDATFRL